MADQKYCRNCGMPNQPIAMFCVNCGTAFAGIVTYPQTAPSPVPSPLREPRQKVPEKTSRKLDDIASKLMAIDPKDRNARNKVINLMWKLWKLNVNDMRMVNLYKIGLNYVEGFNDPQYKGLEKLVETYPNDAVGKEAERVLNPLREKYRIWKVQLPWSIQKISSMPSICACCGDSERLNWTVPIGFESPSTYSLITSQPSKYIIKLPVCDDCASHAAPRSQKIGRFPLDPSFDDTTLKKSCRAVPVSKARIAGVTYAGVKIWFRNKDFAYEFGRLNNLKVE